MPIVIPDALGSKIDLLGLLKERRRGLEEAAAGTKADEVLLEEAILAQLDVLQIEKTSHGGYSASKSVLIVPNVTDWDVLHSYIKRSGYFHLLQRRVSTEACRELFETKGKIPGVVPFTQTKLSFRRTP